MKNSSIRKRIVAFMLFMVMVISILPMDAQAANYDNENTKQEFSIKRINKETIFVDSKDGSELVTVKDQGNFKKS